MRLPILCNVADLDVVKGDRPAEGHGRQHDATRRSGSTARCRCATRASICARWSSPKDISPLTLRTPVHVKGTFGKPEVSLELGKLVGKAGAAGLLALLNPLAALIPFIDPGAKKDAARNDAECANLVATSGAIPSAVHNPKSTHVPPLASAASSALR